MHPAVYKLAMSTHYSTNDLLAADDVFFSCDEEERSWYVKNRIDMVFSKAGCADFRNMQTSGYQDGRPRNYIWGPCFYPMSEFFDRLRYGSADAIVYLTYYERVDGDPFILRDIRWDPPYKHYIFGIRRDRFSYDEIFSKLSEICGDNIGIVMSPSIMDTIILGGFAPSRLDPDRYVIHATGEPLLNEAAPFVEAGLVVRDNMRCWDGGATFFTCQHGNKHWVDLVSKHWVEGDELVSSDLFNMAQNFVEYRNGDRITWNRGGMCACGRPIDHISFNIREQKVVVENNHFQYRKLREAFDTSCKSFGANTASLQVGVDEKKRVVTFYGQASTELPSDFEKDLRECLCATQPWLSGWSIRYSRRRGKVSSYKRFPVFKEDVYDFFENL